MADHDQEILDDLKPVLKVFDPNGNVNEDNVVRCVEIYSHRLMTIFFYEDDTFQIMIHDQAIYGSFVI